MSSVMSFSIMVLWIIAAWAIDHHDYGVAVFGGGWAIQGGFVWLLLHLEAQADRRDAKLKPVQQEKET